MTSPIDWPPPVLPGQTITDTWGNQVVAGIRMVPGHVRGQKPEFLPTPNTPIDLTGAAGLVDPLNRLGANGIYAHTQWAGLWSVHATYTWRSYLGTETQGCRFWFQIGSTVYAQVADQLLGPAHGNTTSTIVVLPPNGVLEFRYEGINHEAAYLTVDFAACWIGPAS
jgi:hypothetical protein